MHLQFVGCGDAFGSGGRFNTCFHLVGAATNLLIDCGASSLVALKRFDIAREPVDAILLTHFHADHFGGVPFFVLDAQFSGRTRPLTIAGPPGLDDWVMRAMETAFEHSSKVARKFEIRLVTLPERAVSMVAGVEVTPFPVVHGKSGGPFYALRIAAEERTVTYSGDTEWTDSLVAASEGADLFVAESYVYERLTRNHLSYAALVENRHRLSARRIVLTHMSPDMLAHAGDVPETCAEDGMVLTL
jgi:ribonuclease BN (tRNA processing enzyme)